MQPPGLDPFDGEHLVAETEGHEDAADEGLAALCLSGETNEFASGKARTGMKPEQELHLGNLRVWSDATAFQLLQPLFVIS